MSFADPLVITINAVAKSLPRITPTVHGGSEYFLREATEDFRVKIRHSTYTATDGTLTDRHNIEFTNTVYATLTERPKVRKAYSVYENGRSDTAAAVLQDFVGFVGFNTSANIQKLLNYES